MGLPASLLLPVRTAVGASYDEALAAPGEPRAHYEAVLGQLAECDLSELADRVAGRLRSRGVVFGGGRNAAPFAVDPVPRLLLAQEWETLESGLRQRSRALRAFIADVYGERRIVSAGIMAESTLATAEGYEPELVGRLDASNPDAVVIGYDVVRDADGGFLVLEDNSRTPSGVAYASAATEAVCENVDVRSDACGPAWCLPLGDVLREAGGGPDTSIVLLSDGPGNSAFFEHHEIAAALDVPLVTLADLAHRGGRLTAWVGHGTRPVDVVYRRTNESRLRDEAGRPTAVAEALLEPALAGAVAVVNGFGSGVADDKLVHAHVEEMIELYLEEQPILPSVRTHDLGRPEVRDAALARLDELVVKPRFGHGGEGIVIGPQRPPRGPRRRSRRGRRPEGFVAQETVCLSCHPTVCAGELHPRHVDLRVFAYAGPARTELMPAGLTRYAREEGALVVNSSRGGGAKATWVLP